MEQEAYLGAVEPVPDTLADDLSWVHEIVKDGLVDGCQGPASRAGAGEAILGGWHDAAGSHHHHILGEADHDKGLRAYNVDKQS